MVDLNALRGKIAERGLSQRMVAEKLGITEKTFYSKMKTGNFSVMEAERIAQILEIETPGSIFFRKEVTYQDT